MGIIVTSRRDRRGFANVAGMWMLLAVFFAAPALRSFGQGAPTPKVTVGYALDEIRTSQADSDSFYMRFELQFSWNPAAVPSFDPHKIIFYNAARDLSIKEVTPKVAAATGTNERTATLMVSGYFKGYLDFQDFPFDSHDLPIVFYDPGAQAGQYEWVSAGNRIHNSPVYEAQLDGWNVNSIRFFNKSSAFRYSAPATRDFSAPVFGAFSVDITRNETSHVVRLFIPILIIWLISYMGLFWDDSSPASRCGTAAIFAGITFALGTNFLNPPVNYLTVMNVVFLGLYTNIGIDFFLVTVRFWAKARNYKRAEKFFWWGGVIACPVMMAITAILCVSLAKSREPLKTLSGPPAAIATFAGAGNQNNQQASGG